MEQYNDIFENIAQRIDPIRIYVPSLENELDLCVTCRKQMFLDVSTDQLICNSCGRCVKAYQEVNEFRKEMTIISTSHRHKYLRLNKRLKQMGIAEGHHETIKNMFKIVIDFFTTIGVQNRKNILRYDYIIFRIVEMKKIPFDSNYSLKLTYKTIKKYNDIWSQFCKYIHNR